MVNRQVIVIGGNHHNTLAILRSLGEKGVHSSLIVLTGDKKPFTTYSKYIKRSIILRSYEGIKDAMYELKEADEKPIVIACSDRVSSYLDLNRDELREHFLLPESDKQGRITELMEKNKMSNLAAECGFQIPYSVVLDTHQYDTSYIEFPCIIKPLSSIEGTKSDIFVCNNEKEFIQKMSLVRCPKVQVQQYIDKDIEYQLIGLSLKGGEEVIIPGASVILRQPENTNTGFLKYIPKCGFNYEENICKDFLKATRYSGLFSLEFLRGKDGKDYFMEINFRNDGNSICVTASGMNLPYIWYLYNCSYPYLDELNYDGMREVFVMPEIEDFHNVMIGKLSLWQWLRDIKKTDRFMEYSKYDQSPFWQKLKTLLMIHLGLEKNNPFV